MGKEKSVFCKSAGTAMSLTVTVKHTTVLQAGKTTMPLTWRWSKRGAALLEDKSAIPSLPCCLAPHYLQKEKADSGISGG